MVVDEEVQADMGLDGGLRTARVLVDMANSIFDYLQFTDDCPSLRASGWMPLLDLEVRIASHSSVDWRFYSKPCSSQYVMMKK